MGAMQEMPHMALLLACNTDLDQKRVVSSVLSKLLLWHMLSKL